MMKPRQMDGNEAKPRILTGIWFEDQRVEVPDCMLGIESVPSGGIICR